MAKSKITLYVDIVSPFAYLGFYALQNFPVFKQCEITYIPILLGGLMKACGNTPPLQIKNKDKWINTERIRWSTLYHIPISPALPPGFPISTLPLQRSLVSLSLSHPSALPAALTAFYNAFWVDYAAPQEPANLLKILAEVLDGGEEEARRVVERAGGKEAKEGLVRNTDAAMGEGAFGLPWFVATNFKGEKEGFWGFDHIGQMLDHLGLERPDEGGWRAML
ncbi:HCCA isomerase/glutathione S-transferase kappa [Lepidopterella palustris CBS 459.81]|uniref:Glutathione S-transferase kappa n=1 Tax=Lepidopterella palustris CBS 459.81 TaxID=1314670 RepID=A0A8E2E4G5_9PEZI|nr:HCCA isomerase/glutathione S-transferase kappa [Lepidopterella palustris CBS 459.81]